MKKYALAVVVLLAVSVCDALAATLAGRVVGVSDGDTLTELTAENRQFKIRQSGIDAPEKNSPSARTPGNPSPANYSASRSWSSGPRPIAMAGSPVKSKSTVSTSISNTCGKVRPGCTRNTFANCRSKTASFTSKSKSKPNPSAPDYDAHPEPPWEWRKEKRAHYRTGS